MLCGLVSENPYLVVMHSSITTLHNRTIISGQFISVMKQLEKTYNMQRKKTGSGRQVIFDNSVH